MDGMDFPLLRSSDRAVMLSRGVPIVNCCRPSWSDRSSGSLDRKSTRLNSSHLVISYAVFCLKKKPQIAVAPGALEILIGAIEGAQITFDRVLPFDQRLAPVERTPEVEAAFRELAFPPAVDA